MKVSYSFVFGLVFGLFSCRMGREYTRPDLHLPAAFRSDAPDSTNGRTVPGLRHFFRNPQLTALIDTALLKNTDLLIAVKNLESARLTLRKVKLNYLPDLDMQLTGNHNLPSRNSLAGIGNEQFTGARGVKDFSATVGLNWEIDLWGRIRKEKEEALANLLQLEEVRKGVQTGLVAAIANGYYNLLMLDDQLRIADKSLELTARTLDITRSQYKVGEASLLALRQVEAQLEQVRQLRSQLLQSIGLQENALSLLCGNYAGGIRREAAASEFGALPSAGYDAGVLTYRPDVRAAEMALVAANARTGITQALMYPTLAITASGGLNSFRTSDWFSIPASLFGTIGGNLTQPVFRRRELKTRHEQALVEREKAVLNFRQAVLAGYTEVSDAMAVCGKLEEQSAAARKRREALEEGIEASKVLFRTGMSNYLEVITAESNYLQASLNEVELVRLKAGAAIALYRALGGGWK